jgi:oligogalacturonide transporter
MKRCKFQPACSRTWRIRAFRQHLSLYLGGYLSQDIFNTAFPIFVATVLLSKLGATLAISQLMTTMYLAQLVSVLVAIRVVIKVGPLFAYRAAITLFITAALLYGYFYWQQRGGAAVEAPSTLWLFGPIVLAGLGRGTLNFVPWSVYNYLPDVDEAVTGQRREGIFAGVMTLVRKLAQSLALIGTGWLIEVGGYVSPKSRPGELVVQSPEAVQTVVLVLVLGPIVAMLLGLLGAWRFRLNASSHWVLVNEVERLRAGATTAESPASQRIVEELTGWRYEDLWGRGGKERRAPERHYV